MDKVIEKELIKLIKANYPKNSGKIIEAYKFADRAHEGVLRKSGEPYIIHPVSVAKILIENNMDYFTVMAGLLHDVVEDTSYTLDDISNLFGETVARLVDGVTKIDSKTLSKGSQGEEVSIQKLILSMGTDIRVILIKLADRLHNMRTVGYLSREKQIRMASETNELFIPIAERLGIRRIRSELQELTFKCLHPEDYEKIKKDFDKRLSAKLGELKKIEKKLKSVVAKTGLKVSVVGWPEHYYSIHKKMLSKEGIGKVYGLMLFKLIIDGDDLDCYRVLGLLHRTFRHIPEQIKDFISSPKPNGYRSLHTVLITDSGDVTFKVMIRTEQMDKICEFGVSWLWHGSDADEGFSNQIEKYNSLKQITSSESSERNPAAFIKAIKNDLFSNVTWVFTPKLKPICLSSDSPTAVDFAYGVHTDIGHWAVGVNINGKKSALSTTLKAGDIVEVLVSSEPKAPSRSWLSFVKTTSARQKINKYFAEHFTQHNIERGKRMLAAELESCGHSLEDLQSFYPQINAEYNFASEAEMFASVGYESVTVQQIIFYLLQQDESRKLVESAPVEFDAQIEPAAINYPKCCSAIPGDEIVAHISKNGISIHRSCCSHLKSMSPENLIAARWKPKVMGKFSATIKILADDEVGFGGKLLSLLAKLKLNLEKTVARKSSSTTCEFELGLSVKNTAELDLVMEKIKTLGGVRSVTRTFE